jgi:hypothetical protein
LSDGGAIPLNTLPNQIVIWQPLLRKLGPGKRRCGFLFHHHLSGGDPMAKNIFIVDYNDERIKSLKNLIKPTFSSDDYVVFKLLTNMPPPPGQKHGRTLLYDFRH